MAQKNAAGTAADKASARQRLKNATTANTIVDFKLMRDAYFGTGGFADGSYLIQHKREKVDKYNNRKDMAYYLNYTAPAVNSHVDPIFRQEIKRDWKGPGSALFEKFTQDTDKAGTSIQGLAKRAALGAKLFGVNFVVVDNAAEQPDTLAKAIEARVLPYAYIVEPDRVKEVKTDRFGRLTKFSYTEPVDRDNADQDDQEYNIRTWTTTGWYVTDKERKKIQGMEGQHNLKRVPVTVWPSREMDPADVMRPSEFGAIIRTNLHIYQLCSWLSEILQNQAFSILIYPSREGTNLVVGTDNALGFPEDASHPPDFISPPADPAKMIADHIDRLIQEIYRMANLTLVTGVKEQKSGVAKAWDFERTNQTLADFAGNCQAAEKDIAEIFKLWIQQDLEYTVEYATDFKIVDVADELANAEAAVSLNLGTAFLVEIAKKILAAYLPGLDAKTYDTIIEELKAKGVDEMMARVGSYDPAKDLAKKLANMNRLSQVMRKLMGADGVDPADRAAAEEALQAAGLAA